MLFEQISGLSRSCLNARAGSLTLQSVQLQLVHGYCMDVKQRSCAEGIRDELLSTFVKSVRLTSHCRASPSILMNATHLNSAAFHASYRSIAP